jgi:hypothetical protein
MAKKSRKLGAPTKLTKQRVELISDAISIGAPLTAAARYGQISYNTFVNWHKKGEMLEQQIQDGTPMPYNWRDKMLLYFYRQVEEAKAEAAINWVTVINDEAAVNPQWASWMLTKWFPEQFAERSHVDVTTGGEALPVSKIVEQALDQAYGSDDSDEDTNEEE